MTRTPRLARIEPENAACSLRDLLGRHNFILPRRNAVDGSFFDLTPNDIVRMGEDRLLRELRLIVGIGVKGRMQLEEFLKDKGLLG